MAIYYCLVHSAPGFARVQAIGVAAVACYLKDLAEVVAYFLFLDVEQPEALDTRGVDDPRMLCRVV